MTAPDAGGVVLWWCPACGHVDPNTSQSARYCGRGAACVTVKGARMESTAMERVEYVPASRLQEALREAGDPIAAAEAHNATLCLRTLVGQGTDTWDPLCVLVAGHDGACKSVAALREGGTP